MVFLRSVIGGVRGGRRIRRKHPDHRGRLHPGRCWRSGRAALRAARRESAVDRVQLIQQLYAAGMASRTIVGLLPCIVSGEMTPELIDRLSAERDRIDRQISDRRKTRDRLDTAITQATTAWTTGKPCPR